jgi:hypothetical protein
VGNQVLDIAQMRSSIGWMGERRALERPRWIDRSTSGGATGGATQIVQQFFPYITASLEALEDEPLQVQAAGFDSRNRTLGLFVEHLIVAAKDQLIDRLRHRCLHPRPLSSGAPVKHRAVTVMGRLPVGIVLVSEWGEVARS